MLKRMFIFGVMALWFTGCQSGHITQEEQYAEYEGLQTQEFVPEQLTSMDIYSSLEELCSAFEGAPSSDAKKISDDRVYYLIENNDLHLLLKEICVREGYFNCMYDNGVCIYTHRLEDGATGLEVMTTNNPDIFIEKQENGFEYYYASDEDYQYFLWLQEGDLVQLNVPNNVDIYLEDIIRNLTHMSVG